MQSRARQTGKPRDVTLTLGPGLISCQEFLSIHFEPEGGNLCLS